MPAMGVEAPEIREIARQCSRAGSGARVAIVTLCLAVGLGGNAADAKGDRLIQSGLSHAVQKKLSQFGRLVGNV